MDYQRKYLKYKQKYYNLKKMQLRGGNDLDAKFKNEVIPNYNKLSKQYNDNILLTGSMALYLYAKNKNIDTSQLKPYDIDFYIINQDQNRKMQMYEYSSKEEINIADGNKDVKREEIKIDIETNPNIKEFDTIENIKVVTKDFIKNYYKNFKLDETKYTSTELPERKSQLEIKQRIASLL